MKKNIKIFMLIPTIFPMIFIPLSCSNDYNKLHDNFVYQKNIANPATDFSYAYSNSYNDVLKQINLATGAKLFRISSQNQPNIDFRDNITTKPTELWYQFEHCSSITIRKTNLPNDEGITYTKDSIMKAIYQNVIESEKDPNFYYPKKDKGNGFYKPYLFVPSNNEQSINHKSFFDNLKSAYSITLNFKDKHYDNYWINHKGEQTKYKITSKDFWFGLLRSALKNKNYRNKFIDKYHFDQSKEQNEYEKNKNNPYFDGEDIFEFFNKYNIKTDNLFNYEKFKNAGENDSITFESANNSKINFIDFFKNMFLYSNIMDALPYQFLLDKYNLSNDRLLDSTNSFNWFYEYGKTYDKTLFGSYYYVSKNTTNDMKLYRNTHYIKKDSEWQKTKHLNEIVYRYNAIPLSRTAYALQMYNAFKQNIVSSLDITDLNNDQKQYILSNYRKFNLNFGRKYQLYHSHNNIINNYFPKSESYFFNDNFSKLYYGKGINQLKQIDNISEFYTKNSFIFKSLINNVINPQTLIRLLKLKNDIWMSQAPADINIDGTTKNDVNYETLKDAQANINKQFILENDTENKLSKWNNTNQYDNKQKSIKNLTNLYESLKSIDFDFIKKKVNEIIEKYYKENSSDKPIEWDIPIEAFGISDLVKEKLKYIEKIYREIHPRLKPRVVFVDSYEKYDLYYKQGKSIYSENKFTLLESNTISFILEMLKTNNYKYLSLMINMYEDLNSNTYKSISRMFYSLDDSLKLKLKNLKNSNLLTKGEKQEIENAILNYLSEESVQSIVDLINEINNIFSYTISIKNNVSLFNFEKTVYQKFITKPMDYNGLSYLQDIYLE